MLAKNILLILIFINFSCVIGFASEEDPDIDAIEAEFTKKKEEPAPESESLVESRTKRESDEDLPPEKIGFSDLSKLVEFSEVSVIQKKFMPKTNRFQFHIGANYLSNNPFYDTVGLVGHLAFYFTESIGIEASAMALNRSPKYVTEDLKDIHGVQTSSMVSANSYYGLSLVFVPFYGKITWLDKRIIPYDIFVSIGGGSTGLTDLKDPASTMHFGAGQIYALTKNFVLRWDFGVNSYQAQVPEISSTVTTDSKKQVQSFTDVFIGGGVSFLFPGAHYR